MASPLHLIHPVRRRMSCCDSCCHSRCNAASTRRMFCTGDSRACQPTVLYGGGPVMVWMCISLDCKLDLVTIQGNLAGDQYIRDVLQPVVDPACSQERYTSKTLLGLHRKGQLAGCSLGYRQYFCVSKPSFGRKRLSTRTVRNRLKSSELKSRRVI
jgi:hypothetical protein